MCGKHIPKTEIREPRVFEAYSPCTPSGLALILPMRAAALGVFYLSVADLPEAQFCPFQAKV